MIKMFVIIIFFIGLYNAVEAPEFEVTVTAGDLNRLNTIVSFSFPIYVESGIYQMENNSGECVTIQVDDNTGWFLLDSLDAGDSVTYSIDTSRPHADLSGPEITIQEDYNTITFKYNGRSILRYFSGDNILPDSLDDVYKRGGYIQPAYSPKGTVVTSHLNTDLLPHHYGIWTSWTNTQFRGRDLSFWDLRQKNGKIVQADSVEYQWQGPVHSGIQAQHRYLDLSSNPSVVALNEKWGIYTYSPVTNDHSYNRFDLVITQTANSGNPLIIKKHVYGGLGLRGHSDWDDSSNGTFMTSEGLGRDGNETRSRWVHIGGHSDGKQAGIAIFGHPENTRHPQPMRIHPELAFLSYAPNQLGEMAIEPGTPYVAEYRFITYDGEPDLDLLDQLWYDYAYPPGVTVKVLQ
ncbi:MAG: PmoA family protein [Balneolales bacterium]